MNAAAARQVYGVERASSRSHYLIGNNPNEWRTRVANFAQVKYEAVYPGVDAVWYGNGRQIEYDLLIAPGALPDRIKLRFAGEREMRLDDNGTLIVRAAIGHLHRHQ